MTQTFDLGPAAERMAALLHGISDDQLSDPTPCPEYTVGDLVEHVGGLTTAFTWAATKTFPEGAGEGEGASGDASRLPEGWRDEFGARLMDLADAWRDPAAWEGMTQAGGVHLPGEIGGIVALDELVVHGWDVARGSRQDCDCDPASLQACLQFLEPLDVTGREYDRTGGFGPVVTVSQDAPELHRLIGLAGRDPGWCPS